MKKTMRTVMAGGCAMVMLALWAAPEALAQRFSVERFARRGPEWFAGDEARAIADNVLTYQTASGGWPKNTAMERSPADPDKKFEATIDNRSTYPQTEFMGHMFAATKDERYGESFRRGLEYLLVSQYENGGWPQFYPLKEGYYEHITYNDDAMVGVMNLLRKIARDEMYEFVPAEKRAACAEAVDKGIRVILDTQIRVDGKLTVWCAQHDRKTLEPVMARSYELPSLSGSESVGVTLFLMSIEEPSPEVIAAVEGAVAWFETAKLTGIRQVWEDRDKRIVEDPDAGPLWGRFNEIGTNRPFFSGRDGVKKYSMAEIEAERRNNYGWYTNAPSRVLAAYPEWKQRIGGGIAAAE